MKLCVFIQHEEDTINSVSLEALQGAQEIAEKSGGTVSAVTFSSSIGDKLIGYKLSEILVIDSPQLENYHPLHYLKTMENTLVSESPDIFIGIDSPDFNLPISKDLKGHGIKTVQYVSPTIWAWRQGRLKTIEKSVDTVMNLFPFENKAYESSSVTTAFVGHPLAHKIPKKINKQELKEERFSITTRRWLHYCLVVENLK